MTSRARTRGPMPPLFSAVTGVVRASSSTTPTCRRNSWAAPAATAASARAVGSAGGPVIRANSTHAATATSHGTTRLPVTGTSIPPRIRSLSRSPRYRRYSSSSGSSSSWSRCTACGSSWAMRWATAISSSSAAATASTSNALRRPAAGTPCASPRIRSSSTRIDGASRANSSPRRCSPRSARPAVRAVAGGSRPPTPCRARSAGPPRGRRGRAPRRRRPRPLTGGLVRPARRRPAPPRSRRCRPGPARPAARRRCTAGRRAG